MMNNLFIMFDPSTNFWSMNWLALFMILMLFPKQFYFMKTRINFIFMNNILFICKDIKNNIYKNYYKSLMIFIYLFNFIYLSNLISLAPFIFTPTSHMSISFFLSLPFWTALMLKGWSSDYNSMLKHLVPLNTPIFLCPFMVIIETISNLIRPITLSIRLSANMIAGHILIALLSESMLKTLMMFFSKMMFLNIMLLLEMAVAIIQSYVFVILISLYLKEINN